MNKMEAVMKARIFLDALKAGELDEESYTLFSLGEDAENAILEVGSEDQKEILRRIHKGNDEIEGWTKIIKLFFPLKTGE